MDTAISFFCDVASTPLVFKKTKAPLLTTLSICLGRYGLMSFARHRGIICISVHFLHTFVTPSALSFYCRSFRYLRTFSAPRLVAISECSSWESQAASTQYTARLNGSLLWRTLRLRGTITNRMIFLLVVNYSI